MNLGRGSRILHELWPNEYIDWSTITLNLRDSANTDSWKNLKEKNKGKKSIANMTNLLRIFLTRLMVNMNWSIDNEVETTNHVDINMSEDGKSDVLDSADNDCSKALNVSDEIDSKDVLDLSSNSEEGLVRRENFDKLNYPTDIDDESEKDNLSLKTRILGSNKNKNERYNQSTGNVEPAPEVSNHLDDSLPDTELADDNLLDRGKRVKKPSWKLLEAEPLCMKKKQKSKL